MNETSKIDDLETGVPVINSALDVPIIFADGLYNVSSFNGVARMSFVQNLADPTNSPNGPLGFRGRNVVTIAIPLHQLVFAAKYLEQTISNFRTQGLLPPDSDDNG